jgi:hypothetical protein
MLPATADNGGTPVDLKDRWVHFMIRDVYVPDPLAVLTELYGADLLQGRVLDVSDSGVKREAFAVVVVDGLKQPVIVPIEKILGVL